VEQFGEHLELSPELVELLRGGQSSFEDARLPENVLGGLGPGPEFGSRGLLPQL
jgi:hypothetical protein